MAAAGVAAIKIEGRQRSPVYVAQVTKVWREALDSFTKNPTAFTPKPEWTSALGRVSEGAQTTLGPYHRPWQ
jgi:putative protease